MREITLKELLGIMLKQSGKLLLAVLLSALLLCGFRCVSLWRGNTANTDDIQENYQYELQMYEQEQHELQARNQQLEVDLQQALLYNENSLKMQINPYDKQVLQQSFNITIDSETLKELARQTSGEVVFQGNELLASAENRIAEYYMVMLSNLNWDAVTAGTEYHDVTEYYWKELFRYVRAGGGLITVELTGPDSLDLAHVMQTIESYVLSQKPMIESMYIPHDLLVVQHEIQRSIDLDLVDYQRRNEEKPLSIQKELQANIQTLNNMEPPQEPSGLSLAAIAKSGVKYGILGACMAFLLGACLIYACFVFNRRIQTVPQLKQYYHWRHLGSLSDRKLSGIQAVAEEMMGNPISGPKNDVDIILSNIYAFSGNSKSLLVTGTVPEKDLEKAMAFLQPLEERYGIEIKASCQKKVAIAEQMKAADGVVVVEALYRSNLSDIAAQADIMEELSINVIGVLTI